MREDKPHLDGTFLHVFPTEAQISGLLHRKVICRVWRGEPARGSCREMPARRPEQPLRTAGSKSKSRLIWPGSSLSLSKDATTEVGSTACEPETSTSGSLIPRCLTTEEERRRSCRRRCRAWQCVTACHPRHRPQPGVSGLGSLTQS